MVQRLYANELAWNTKKSMLVFMGVFCTKVNMLGTLIAQNVEVQGTNKWA
jgi:hypothetical protein